MASNNKTLFAKQLKECRKYAKVSQEELALSAGLEGGSSISHYENRSSLPTKERLNALANALKEKGVPSDDVEKLYLYCGYNEQPFSNHYTERVNNILEGSHKETRWLLQWLLDKILEQLEKYQLALTKMRRGENEEAQDIFDRLLPTTSNLLQYNERLRLKLLVSSAETRRLQGELHSAIGYLKQAEDIAKKMGESGLEELATILKLRGNIYRRLSEWKSAKDDFNYSIQTYREYEYSANIKQDAALAKLERKLAGTHLFQGQPRESISHIDRSINIYHELEDDTGRIQGLQHRAWAIALLGKLDDALKIHKDIIRNCDNQKTHSVTLAKSYRYLGDSYRMCGMPEKANEIYQQAKNHLDLFFKGNSETKDVLTYGTINLGIGASFRALKDHYRANRHLEESIKLHMNMGAKYYEALSRRELGKMMSDTEQFSLAESEFNKSKSLFAELDNEYYLIGINRDLADLEFRRGNFAKARAFAATAIKQANDLQFSARCFL